ncbi:MAG: H-NS histone family protein [Luteimonas sp.]|nr:H-NS histone family protein [Luteimonas sp.]
MTIDLNALSSRELDALINQAKKRKTTLTKRKPVATVRSKLTALAKAEGYSIAELFGGAAKAKATGPAKKRVSPNKGRKLGKVPAKYRNPANAKETWSGRGKQPRWLAALTKKGKKAEDFLIKK